MDEITNDILQQLRNRVDIDDNKSLFLERNHNFVIDKRRLYSKKFILNQITFVDEDEIVVHIIIQITGGGP